jgi:hypothetical protein
MTAVRRPPLRAIEILSFLELASLTVLIVNLATAHLQAITSAIGPIHGVAYLSVAATVLFGRGLLVRTRLLPLVPGLGALLALWCVRVERRRLATEPQEHAYR